MNECICSQCLKISAPDCPRAINLAMVEKYQDEILKSEEENGKTIKADELNVCPVCEKPIEKIEDLIRHFKCFGKDRV